MFDGKPIIGIVGGIGSGKSFVAQAFGELGALVIDADALVREVYRDAAVLKQIQEWWGADVVNIRGELDRRRVARIIFSDQEQRRKLERLVHPLVAASRIEQMRRHVGNQAVTCFAWDIPLLFETGLHGECDAVVFVQAPFETRLKRVSARGWDEDELRRRENMQVPLDSKREMSDYVIDNSAELPQVKGQVRDVFSRITSRLEEARKP